MADEVMIIVAHSGQTFVGVGHEDRRSIKILSRSDSVAEQSVIDTHDKSALIILIELHLSDKAARVHQGEAVA